MNIVPVNGHLLIEPVKHEAFIESQNQTYDEIAVVKALADGVEGIPVGCKVYFDSFMAKKYPPLDQGGEDIWLLHKDEVVGIVNEV